MSETCPRGKAENTTHSTRAAGVPHAQVLDTALFHISPPGRLEYRKGTTQRRTNFMDFFNSAVDVLQTLVVALGAGLGIWGAINLLEGYGNDNPGAKSQGMKHLILN